MIELLKHGKYHLFESVSQTKLLQLDSKHFAWINAKDIGEILVSTHRTHRLDCLLSIGSYRLYAVLNEPEFSDMQHLELFVGDHTWQGYLLPTGLPTPKKARTRIIPTNQTITTASRRHIAEDVEHLVHL